MIEFRGREINEITFRNLVPQSINFRGNSVWPSSFYYTLTFSSITYSNTSDRMVHANGSDYCEIKCKYKKYRTVDSGLVSDELVTVIPSAEYFVAKNTTQLYFNRETYGTTIVNGGDNISVKLSYEAATPIYTTFKFQGNTSAWTYELKTDVSPKRQSAPAKGLSYSFSGGVLTKHKDWTSGSKSDYSDENAVFDNSTRTNSGSNVFEGKVNGRNVIIPSLDTNEVMSGEYTFVCSQLETLKFYVSQDANNSTGTTTYEFYDGTSGSKIEGNYYVDGNSGGSFKFYLVATTSWTYTSTAHSSHTVNYDNNSWLVEAQADQYNMVTGITRDTTDGKSFIVGYKANDYDYEVNCIIAFKIGSSGSYQMAFTFAQYGATIYYELQSHPAKYSDGGTQLLANGSNYCEFPCSYRKMRGITVISSTGVTGTPVAVQYFKVNGTKLSFNSDSYGTTAVTSGSMNVVVKYVPAGGDTVQANTTFKFQGNTYTSSNSWKEDVKLDPNVQIAPASGTTLTYTGGTYESYDIWTSGQKTNVVTHKATFDPANNSSITGATGSVREDDSYIIMPNLRDMTGNTGTYTFTCTVPGLTHKTFQVTQEGNYGTNYYVRDLYDGNNNLIEENYSIGSDAGSFKFYVSETVDVEYTSKYRNRGTPTPVSNAALTAITSGEYNIVIMPIEKDSDGHSFIARYNQNTETITERDEHISVSKSGTGGFSIGFNVIQSAATFHYTLTASVTYSDTVSNKVHATGTDYCTVTCKYNKVIDGGQIIETTDVTSSSTITAPTYFSKRTYDTIKYNYDSYKATEVGAGDNTVQFAYNGYTTSTVFSFAGNSALTTDEITAVTVQTTVGAAGGNISYTGGTGRKKTTWSSLYTSATAVEKIEFNDATNSANENFNAYVNTGTSRIYVQSLGTTVVAQGVYQFTSEKYPSAAFSITQSANSAGTPISIRYAASTDPSFNRDDTTFYVDNDSQGTLTFHFESANKYIYTSGESAITTPSTITVKGTITIESYGGPTFVSASYVDNNGNIAATYSKNTGTEGRENDIVVTITSGGGTYDVYAGVRQGWGDDAGA